MMEENNEKRYHFPRRKNEEIIKSNEFIPCHMCETFKDFLKKEARVILNNLNNYLIKVYHPEPSICKFCNMRIAQPSLPLVLWNRDQMRFIEFHVQCAIKKEKLKEFLDFLNDFDYIYEIDE